MAFTVALLVAVTLITGALFQYLLGRQQRLVWYRCRYNPGASLNTYRQTRLSVKVMAVCQPQGCKIRGHSVLTASNKFFEQMRNHV
jgi:hypothetical protein